MIKKTKREKKNLNKEKSDAVDSQPLHTEISSHRIVVKLLNIRIDRIDVVKFIGFLIPC